jgi:hypothetical protein
MSRRTGLEREIREFQALSKRVPLADRDLTRAKQLMVTMRRAGYTNEEISDLVGGAWKESTVKLYTRGTVVADKSFKTDSTKLLTQFIEEDLTIEELRSFLAVKTVLDSKEARAEQERRA